MTFWWSTGWRSLDGERLLRVVAEAGGESLQVRDVWRFYDGVHPWGTEREHVRSRVPVLQLPKGIRLPPLTLDASLPPVESPPQG